MKFENPDVDHDVNVTAGKPLVDFVAIAVSLVVVAAIATIALYFAAGWIAQRLPFSAEVKVAAPFFEEREDPSGRQAALRALADRLVPLLDLPAGVSVRVHYRDEATVNALATLGGNVIMYRGLLERMPHENALAMVLAHEIAHVKHRDPVVGAGRGIALAVALGAISAGAGQAAAGDVVGTAATLTALRFGREQEEAADTAALGALARLYGHVGGAADLFKAIQAEAERRGAKEPPPFLATHPLTPARIERIAALARERGWPGEGPITALPPALATKPAATR